MPSAVARGVHILFALILLITLSLPYVPVARADEGWFITSFDAQIEILDDGSLDIAETLLVDFGDLKRHGIFREIPVVYEHDDESNRVYELSVTSVTDAQGRPYKHEIDRIDGLLRIKIGDPDVTVTGPQSYRIVYRVRGALNAFAEHDELFWNVTGQWPVRTQRTSATVILPGDGVQQVTCYQGALGSRETCRFSTTPRTALFEATRSLGEQEQLTVVVAFRKGLVAAPQPKLERKLREFSDFFDITPLTAGGSLLLLVIALGLLGSSWWRFGRDRRYTTIYYLTDNPAEETRPLGSSDPIVVEFTPPETLRPAQAGLLLDETADTLDVTASIVDLAVRGYLHIKAVPKEGLRGRLFGGDEWELSETDKGTADLLEFEKIILSGLFSSGSPVKISELKNKFYTYLRDAREQLYLDAAKKGWFVHRPDRSRALWRVAGLVVVACGIGLGYLLGLYFGAGLVAAPLALAGLLLTGMAGWMPKRTARGRELLRRTLGFRQYIATAETHRQQFNEQQNLFAEYLPWAIVFRCVDKWAHAFRDVDTATTARSWYVGTSYGLNSAVFSRELEGFSSAVSSTIASTPGGSGGSGFSGGSGGGGGGGGGGSW